MTKVLLPTVLRQHSDGHRIVEVGGSNVGQALIELTDKYPELRGQLLRDDGEIRNYVNVFVNDENIRDLDDKATEIVASDEILIVPALAGG